MMKQYKIKNIAWIFAVAISIAFVGCGEEKKAENNEQTKASTTTPASTPTEASSANAKEVAMEGFMTTEWCAEQGMFRDCRMESIVCGEGGCYKHWEFGDKEKMNLVLYVHDDMKAYKVKPTKEFNIPEFLETSINRNAVTVKGSYDEATNTILATSFEAPPPPKKSFFKGCL